MLFLNRKFECDRFYCIREAPYKQGTMNRLLLCVNIPEERDKTLRVPFCHFVIEYLGIIA